MAFSSAVLGDTSWALSAFFSSLLNQGFYFFQLVSSRYEHASLILTSNLPFSGWGGVFGDQAVSAAMIDRVVHHADVLTLKGASYRLRNRGIDTLPSIRTQDAAD